ncbi:hypothetical protein Tco_0511668 [Tanacetum coccineum]
MTHLSCCYTLVSQGSDESLKKIGKARRQARVVLSDDEVFEDDSSKQGRKLSDAEVQEKASTDTELFIQEVTPTEVIQDQEGSEKASLKISLEHEAIRLEEQMNEEQRAQIARDEEIARQWDEEERQRAMDEAKSAKKIDWKYPLVSPHVKEKSPEKVVEKEVDTQEELKEFVRRKPEQREKVPFLEKYKGRGQKLEEEAERKNSKVF